MQRNVSYSRGQLSCSRETTTVSFDMLTGEYPVPDGQLIHDLAMAKVIKSPDVPPSASGYTYYGAYIRYLREFEAVVGSRCGIEIIDPSDGKTGREGLL